MKYILILMVLSQVALGQDIKSDSGLGAIFEFGDYVMNTILPDTKDTNGSEESLTLHLQNMADMANATQAFLAEDLNAGKISFYSYASNMNKVKDLISQVIWHIQGLDKALSHLDKNLGPIHNSNLELELLETSYMMIVNDVNYRAAVDAGTSKEIPYLKRMVQHPQFMRNPNPALRLQGLNYQLNLAYKLKKVGVDTEAFQYMEGFFQKAQSCECMRPGTVTAALRDYHSWLESAQSRPSSLTPGFNDWYQALLDDPSAMIRPDTLEAEQAFEQEMAALIQANLSEMLAASDEN